MEKSMEIGHKEKKNCKKCREDPYLDDVRLRDGRLYLFIDISSRPASFAEESSPRSLRF